ncbi:unnamed protein product [Chrysoparadoxa australica]
MGTLRYVCLGCGVLHLAQGFSPLPTLPTAGSLAIQLSPRIPPRIRPRVRTGLRPLHSRPPLVPPEVVVSKICLSLGMCSQPFTGLLRAMLIRLTPSAVEVEVGVRLVMAVLCGMSIGLERRKAHRPAGVRTMSLVALGAAIFTTVGRLGYDRGDPSRIAANVASGVGFIGAGVITTAKTMHDDEVEFDVKGLTTGTAIWIAAGAGMACAVGLYFTAIVGTLLTVLILRITAVQKTLRESGERVALSLQRLNRAHDGEGWGMSEGGEEPKKLSKERVDEEKKTAAKKQDVEETELVAASESAQVSESTFNSKDMASLIDAGATAAAAAPIVPVRKAPSAQPKSLSPKAPASKDF